MCPLSGDSTRWSEWLLKATGAPSIGAQRVSIQIVKTVSKGSRPVVAYGGCKADRDPGDLSNV